MVELINENKLGVVKCCTPLPTGDKVAEVNTHDGSCRSVLGTRESSTCKECGNKGKFGKEITLKGLLKEPKLKTIKVFMAFIFARHQHVMVSISIMKKLGLASRRQKTLFLFVTALDGRKI